MSKDYEIFDGVGTLQRLASLFAQNQHKDYLVFHDLLGSNSSDDLFSSRFWGLTLDCSSGETNLSVTHVVKLVQIEDDIPSNLELIEHINSGRRRFPKRNIENPPEPIYRVYKAEETMTLDGFTLWINSQADFINKIGRYLVEYPLTTPDGEFATEVEDWFRKNSSFPEYYHELGTTSFKLTVPNPELGKVNSLSIELKRSNFRHEHLVDLTCLLKDVLISEKVFSAEDNSTLRKLFRHFADMGPFQIPIQIPNDIKTDIISLPNSQLGNIFSEIRRISKQLKLEAEKFDWDEFLINLASLKEPLFSDSDNSQSTKE